MNYNVYRFSAKEILISIAIYMLTAALIAYLFYDSMISVLFLSPGIILYFSDRRKKQKMLRSKKVKKEFTDMIMSVSTALSSGYSVENAFMESLKDMSGLYGADSMICTELNGFMKQLSIGITLEDCLMDYSNRTGIEDIKDFAEIFVLAKRNGGDFVRMMIHTAETIKEKEEIENEIEVMLSGKKMEQKIMEVIPFIILLYLRISTGSFLNTLYHNPQGIAIMSVCLVIYVFAVFMAERITDIKV